MEDLGNIPILIPPKSELTQIMDYVSYKLANIDSLSDEAERATSLLQERRTALISAAVTGQIDVRGFQPVAA